MAIINFFNFFELYVIVMHHFFARLVLGFAFACRMPRFLLLCFPLLGEEEDDVNGLIALQTNAHSGAMPKSFSSSESQLHGGAGLGTTFFAAAVAVKGTNVNGETRCLKSVMVIVVCVCVCVCYICF